MDKLVRDRIPEIIKHAGENPVTHKASDEEYWTRLQDKLQEEVKEFLENSSKEELTDVLEVLYAICDFKQWDRSIIESLRQEKANQRGGFKERIILDRIEDRGK